MRRYKLVVVDDEPDREGIYRTVFGSDCFDYHFISDILHLGELQTERADAYLVDLFLSGWGMKGSEIVEKHLPKAPRRAPIFIVSSQWGNPEVMEELAIIVRLGGNDINGGQVRTFYSWEEFADKDGKIVCEDVVKVTRKKLLTELSVFHGESSATPRANEKLRILHISDIHFGDSEFSKHFAFNEYEIAKFLVKEDVNMPPTLLVITGDMAYSGEPGEFAKAKEGIERLFKTVFQCPNNIEANRERMFIVPGNHDINLRLAACDSYDYSRFSGSNAMLSAKPRTTPGQYNALAWKPFTDFAVETTVDREWRYSCTKPWVSNRFLNWGLQFILFNSAAEIDSENPSKATVPEQCDLNGLVDELSGGPSAYRILLTHHGADSFSEPDKTRLDNFMQLANVRLWLHGHRHESQTSLDPRLLISVAPSLSLNTKAQREENLRGFNLIELINASGEVASSADGAIESARIHQFDIRGKEVRPIKNDALIR